MSRRSKDRGAYYHELFLRGRPDLCCRIARVKSISSEVRKNRYEPDFYKMTAVGTEATPMDEDNERLASDESKASGEKQRSVLLLAKSNPAISHKTQAPASDAQFANDRNDRQLETIQSQESFDQWMSQGSACQDPFQLSNQSSQPERCTQPEQYTFHSSRVEFLQSDGAEMPADKVSYSETTFARQDGAGHNGSDSQLPSNHLERADLELLSSSQMRKPVASSVGNGNIIYRDRIQAMQFSNESAMSNEKLQDITDSVIRHHQHQDFFHDFQIALQRTTALNGSILLPNEHESDENRETDGIAHTFDASGSSSRPAVAMMECIPGWFTRSFEETSRGSNNHWGLSYGESGQSHHRLPFASEFKRITEASPADTDRQESLRQTLTLLASTAAFEGATISGSYPAQATLPSGYVEPKSSTKSNSSTVETEPIKEFSRKRRRSPSGSNKRGDAPLTAVDQSSQPAKDNSLAINFTLEEASSSSSSSSQVMSPLDAGSMIRFLRDVDFDSSTEDEDQEDHVRTDDFHPL